jgi:hypothetical protein
MQRLFSGALHPSYQESSDKLALKKSGSQIIYLRAGEGYRLDSVFRRKKRPTIVLVFFLTTDQLLSL